MENEINKFVLDNPNQYCMLLNPSPAKSLHNTLFKVVNPNLIGAYLINFIETSIGPIEDFKVNTNYRLDFTVDCEMFSFFGHDAGVLEV